MTTTAAERHSIDAPTVLEPGASLRTRLLGLANDDRFWGWAAPLAVTIVGGFLRFWHLDRPHKLVFDETYYVKQGASMIKFGHERAVRPDIKNDKLWNSGVTDIFGTAPDFVVHPPVGKWLIGAGQWLFGFDNPVGWRFSVAVLGTLAILMTGRIARRLFGSTLLGTTAALLLAIDGQAFVHSRTGLLDNVVMFWALAGFGCLLIDRDQARRRLADRVERLGVLRFGPGLGMRWWRVAAGLCLGLCTGTKWSGVFFVMAFGLATVCWDVSARRATRSPHWLVTGLFRDGPAAALQLLPIAVATYIGSWAGWFRSTDGYNRQWGAQNPATDWAWLPDRLHAWVLPDALRALWDYHRQMWNFNTTLRSAHQYESNPWSWLVQSRPTAFDYTSYKAGERGCPYTECSRAVSALGNPVIWWGGTIALAVLVVVWLLGRDWRAGAILAGMAGGYLPWFNWQERTIFTFYSVAFVPYVVLALTFVLGMMLGPPKAAPDRRLYGGLAAGIVVLLAALAFIWFYPIWSDQMISHAAWVNRMWIASWI